MLPAAAGLGLKPAHFDEVLQARPALGFFEIHAENYMVAGGPMHAGLERVRREYPLSLHGVGLSLGGEAPPDEAHLARLAALIARYQPAAFSEHLAWSCEGGIFLNDLLPVPYDDATLRRVCAHVARTQERLRCRLLLENPSTYLAFASSTRCEADFLAEVVARTGCGLLLDVNNAWVSCRNRGEDPAAYLAALPLHAVGEIHLAGFSRDAESGLLIDSHGGPVDADVWSLYRQVLARTGPVATLVEWDNDVPALPRLLQEAAQASECLGSLVEEVAA
ncbi:MAG: DUF692 domain-containing protein [Ramlibacter sp.]